MSQFFARRTRPRSAAAPSARRSSAGVRAVLRGLGPGIVAGAADDDPSGIATYSIAGAQLGTALLWTALLTWPLMAAVQLTCARVGMVTGGGLTRALKQKFPRWLLLAATVALLVTNSLNIGADLLGMGDAAADLFGGPVRLYSTVFGVGIALATVFVTYPRFASVLKWLAVVLAAYAITAFITHPNWSEVWHDVLMPRWPHGRGAWSTLVALLGTTISPYLFVWQASQEVEEEKCAGRTNIRERSGATPAELRRRTWDVLLGTLFSNLVMFFVILSCAMTLHRSGITDIESAHQAAEALRPLAGNLASTLYTVGIIGVGALAIPTLAGSTAYMFSETLNWRQGLNERFPAARKFYAIVFGSIAIGVLTSCLHVNPEKALYWTAVINGLLAPVFLVGLLAVIRDQKLMNGQSSSWVGFGIVAVTTGLMITAGIAMFVL